MFKKTLLAAAAVAAFASAAHAQTSTANLRAFGLTADNELISFRTAAPRATSRLIGTISGTLPADAEIVGMDFRPSDGQLYAVGRGGGVYTVSTSDASATLVNQLNVNGVPLALEGIRFGVDFNPVPDRLRIVSDTGQNLRHNPAVGGTTLVDGILNNGMGATVTGVISAAYTNNDADAATSTVLFDLNANGQLQIQIPPNSGGISPVGATGIGPIASRVGFDIYTVSNRAGATVTNVAFATASDDTGNSQLYSVDLSTGLATALGPMRTRAPLVDIALPVGQ